MHTAVIYEGPAGVRVDTDAVSVVGVAAGGMVDAARERVAAGADRIELCGGVGAQVHAAVQAALGSGVPVGSNRYGFESLEAIAAYKQAYGTATTRERLVYRAAGADPARDRVSAGQTTFVAVPDAAAAAAVAGELAAELADGEHGLVELYNGLGAPAAAAAVEATGGRVPVGFVGYDAGA